MPSRHSLPPVTIRRVAALHSPATGIIDSHALMQSYLGDLESAGGQVVFNTTIASLVFLFIRWHKPPGVACPGGPGVGGAAVAVVADAAVCSVGDATDACRKRGRATRPWRGHAVVERVRKVNRKVKENVPAVLPPNPNFDALHRAAAT